MISSDDIQSARTAQAATEAAAAQSDTSSGSSPSSSGPTDSFTLDDFLPILTNLLVPRNFLAAAPTFTPKTLVDSIQFVFDGTTYSLYLFINGDWRQFTNSSPVTQIIAGPGITVAPGSGIGAVTVGNGGVEQLLAGSNITLSPIGGTGIVTVNALYPPTFQVTTGLATRAGNASSGNQTIPHGLGKTPSLLKIAALWASGTPVLLQSFGTYNGTLTNTAFSWTMVGTGGGADHDTTNIVFISDHSGNTQIATVTMDATNINLAWTASGSLGANLIQLLWETWG
ncbi:MAG TPA: hypothetical protein VLC46_26890 [Thermoanaerobaculia bacterium]|jgi:hypothetical protein|nr:hypothetical protein [Thermoanaerobaculia bacterium]